MGHPLLVPRNFVLVSAEMIERTPRPVHGEAQALTCSIAICRILRALVESHGDVRAERNLHVHGVLWSEEMAAAIEVRTEVHALVAHFAQLGEAINLEAAGVGEHGARPADELVQSAHAADGFVSWPQVEMVCVAENNFSAQPLENILRNGFNRAGGAYGHEDWGFDGSVRKMELRAASACGT